MNSKKIKYVSIFFLVFPLSLIVVPRAQGGGFQDFWSVTWSKLFRPFSQSVSNSSSPSSPSRPASLKERSCTYEEIRRGLCKERLKQEEGAPDPTMEGLLGKKKMGPGFTGLGLETDENGNPIFTVKDLGTTTREVPLSSTDCGLTGSDAKGKVFVGWGGGKASDTPADASDTGGSPPEEDDDPKNPDPGSGTSSPSTPSNLSNPSTPSSPSSPTAGSDSPTTPPKDTPPSPNEGKGPLDKFPTSIPLGPDLKIGADGGIFTPGTSGPLGTWGIIFVGGRFTPNPDATGSHCGFDADSERAWQKCQQKCANINPGPDGGGCVCHEEVTILFGGAKYPGRCAQMRCAEDSPNCCQETPGGVDEQAKERMERRRCSQMMPTDDGRGPCGSAEDEQRHCFEHPEDPLCGGRPQAPSGDPRAGDGFFRRLFGF